MAEHLSTLALRLPKELAAELDRLAEETGRSKSYYARQAIIEFLEDRADYLRAVAILERERGSPISPSKKSNGNSGWTIEFRPNARNELRELDRSVQRRLIDYLEQRVIASGNPRQLGKPLRGDKGEFWSYRVGDYRIIALIEDKRPVVVVISVGHRRHVYR